MRFSDGNEVTALSVVLSTVVSYTRLPAPGGDDFAGSGIYYGAAAHEAVNCKGDDVYIVRAANSAGQAAPVDLQEQAVERAAKAHVELTPVAASDAEDDLTDRMDSLGVADACELDAVFAAAGLDRTQIDGVASTVGAGPAEGALAVDGLHAGDRGAHGRDRGRLVAHLAAGRGGQAVLAHGLRGRAGGRPAPGAGQHVVMLGGKLRGITVDNDYDTSLPRVPAFPAELNQVWANLIDNAAHALGGAGTLALRTRRGGDHALVEVTDGGPGIAPEVLPRIWEAFFTTDPPGEGSGLGLDNARLIVERRHRGRIDVDTSPGGTTFAVRLPLQH